MVLLGIYLILDSNQHIFDSFFEIKIKDIVLLLSINLLFLLAFAKFQDRVLFIYGVSQTGRECVGLAFITAFYNLFLPAKGGSALRSAYFKKKYNFPHKKFIAYLIKQSVYTLVVTSFMSSVLLFVIIIDSSMSPYLLVVAILALLISLSIHIFEKKLTNWIAQRKKLDKSFFVGELKFFSISANVVALIVLKGLAFYFAFIAINYPIPLVHSLLIASIVMATNVVSILPGNIGVREFVMGSILHLFGYNISLVIMVSLIDRAAIMIVTISGAILYKYLLLKEHSYT